MGSCCSKRKKTNKGERKSGSNASPAAEEKKLPPIVIPLIVAEGKDDMEGTEIERQQAEKDSQIVMTPTYEGGFYVDNNIWVQFCGKQRF